MGNIRNLWQDMASVMLFRMLFYLAKEHIGQNGRIRVLLLERLQEPIDTSLVVSSTVLVVPKGLDLK